MPHSSNNMKLRLRSTPPERRLKILPQRHQKTEKRITTALPSRPLDSTSSIRVELPKCFNSSGFHKPIRNMSVRHPRYISPSTPARSHTHIIAIIELNLHIQQHHHAIIIFFLLLLRHQDCALLDRCQDTIRNCPPPLWTTTTSC